MYTTEGAINGVSVPSYLWTYLLKAGIKIELNEPEPSSISLSDSFIYIAEPKIQSVSLI